MTLLSRFARIFPELFKKEPPEDIWFATTKDVRRMATPCPICENKVLTGHKYAFFACQVAAEDTDELKEFISLFRERRWQELKEVNRFEGGSNAAIVYALFCHRGGFMMAVRDPVELYDSSNVIGVIRFDEDEAERIRSLSIELHEL